MAKVTYEDYENLMCMKDWKDTPIYYSFRDKEISDELANAIIAANEAVAKMLKIKYEEIDRPAAAKREQERREKMERTWLKVYLTQSQFDLIEGLIGQMSDGMWENNPSYEKYWKNIRLDDDNCLFINVDGIIYSSYSSEHIKECNKVWEQGKLAIKQWLAKKAQLVLNADLRDNQGWDAKKCNAQTFIARECGSLQAKYMNYGVNQTYEQIQDAIDSLKGEE